MKKLSNTFYLIALSAIAVLTHILWFRPGTTLFHYDWVHWSDMAARQAWYALGTWSSFFGFGAPRAQISFSFIENIWSFIVLLGGSFDLAVKLTILIPVAILGFVAPYIAMQQLHMDKFVSFVVALFYASTPYFLLRERSQLQIAFVYAFAPLIFTFFVRAWETLSIKRWILFASAFSLGLYFEVRIMYILTFVLALYAAIFFRDLPGGGFSKRVIKPFLVTLVVLAGLNSFWLLPTVIGGVTASISGLTSRGLFGNWLFDMSHALSLSASSWTGGAPVENFTLQPVPLYLWIVPLIALLALPLNAKFVPHRRKEMLFFLSLAVAGIFLTKQVFSPVPQAYPWLYAHFPGFSLFREASKFSIVTALGYAGLIALGLGALKRLRPKIFYGAAAALALVAIINLIPLVTGNIGGLHVSRQEPQDYAVLNKYIAGQKDFARTVWVPANSQWAYFDATHPMVNAATAMNQEWRPYASNDDVNFRQRLGTFFNEPYTPGLMNNGSVRLVVVPMPDNANDDNVLATYGNNRDFYTSMLDTVPWLKRIDIGTKQVAVYENRGYQPYVAAASRVFALSSTDNLANSYNFATHAIGGKFDFTTNTRDSHATTTRPVFDTNAENIRGNTLTASAESDGNMLLYTNTNQQNLSYVVKGRAVTFSATQRGGLRMNGQLVDSRRDTVRTVGRMQLDPKRHYFLQLGDQLTPLDFATDKTRDFGPMSEPPRLVSTDNTNLIRNPSFEIGLWQKQVSDCDAYDDSPAIDMQLDDSEHTDGRKSLELYAGTHTACTSSAATPVIAGKTYLLNFDYKIDQAKVKAETAYEVTFNDAAHTHFTKYINVQNGDWHTIRRAITTPKGATTFTLKLIAIPYNQLEPTTEYYDNVRLAPLATNLNSRLDVLPHYHTTDLKRGTNTFEYLDPNFTGKNLLANPSLENGLWQKQVSDCDAYDDSPAIKMNSSSSASNGRSSLELQAARHTACTGPPSVPVKESATYVLSFDHESPNAENASYSINFDDPDHTSVTGSVSTRGSWQHFARSIQAPSGARHMQVIMYARPADGDTHTFITNRYDNFQLIAIPNIQDQYYLATNADALKLPAHISSNVSNPAKKTIDVRGASGPFYLTMNEAYQPGWRLALNNNRVNGWLHSWLPSHSANKVSSQQHTQWDNITNGWYVDPAELCKDSTVSCKRSSDGSYDMQLVAEFTPQRWFYTGIGVTTLTFAALTVLSLRWCWRKCRHKSGDRYHAHRQ